MKKHALLAMAAALTAAVAAPASAQTLTGTWQVESQTQRGPQNMTLELVQDGAELTGTVTLSFGGRRGGGGGGRGATALTIEDGTVEGNAFRFGYALEFNGNSIPFSISGTWDGDEMEGTMEGGRGGGRPFSGHRGGVPAPMP